LGIIHPRVFLNLENNNNNNSIYIAPRGTGMQRVSLTSVFDRNAVAYFFGPLCRMQDRLHNQIHHVPVCVQWIDLF